VSRNITGIGEKTEDRKWKLEIGKSSRSDGVGVSAVGGEKREEFTQRARRSERGEHGEENGKKAA
jgi:hypothetical protein